MSKIVIFGNSGSGKSTLAKNLVLEENLAHLDLDTVAWSSTQPPERLPIVESSELINEFLSTNHKWVIEGCYSDLLALVSEQADRVIFMNLPTETCIDNAKRRPWEPHKYPTKAAQDANLDMLVDWIAMYDSRTDTFSKAAHEKLYEAFDGEKTMVLSNLR